MPKAGDSEIFAEFRTEHLHVWLESPDLICVHPYGLIEAKDLLDVAEHLSKHIRTWPYALLFLDQTHQTGVTPDGRKAAATAFHWVPYRGSAFCGPSFAQRTMGRMIMTIINTLRGLDNPTMFYKTEAEARAWLIERRRVVAAEFPPAKE